jgi:hypothetical protein
MNNKPTRRSHIPRSNGYERLCTAADLRGACVRIFRQPWGCVLVVSHDRRGDRIAAACAFPDISEIDLHAEALDSWLTRVTGVGTE